MKILLVEDEPDLLKILQRYLENAGYTVTTATNGEDALTLFYQEAFDLAVVDWMLPLIDGLQLIQKMKTDKPIKALMLTAKNLPEDEVQALTMGADDYLRKPFKAKVLLVRIAKLLHFHDQISIYKLSVQPQQRQFSLEEHAVELSKTEFDLLFYLFQNENHPLSREQLATQIWPDYNDKDFRTIDSFIRRLRHKIGSEYIKTIHGVGYQFENQKK